jgi:hypothetical protein
LAAIVNPSEVTQAANNSFFIATPDRECGIQTSTNAQTKAIGTST